MFMLTQRLVLHQVSICFRSETVILLWPLEPSHAGPLSGKLGMDLGDNSGSAWPKWMWQAGDVHLEHFRTYQFNYILCLKLHKVGFKKNQRPCDDLNVDDDAMLPFCNIDFGGERMEFHLPDPSPACIARLGCSCKVQISLFQWGTGGRGRLDAIGESSNGRKPAFTQSLAPETMVPTTNAPKMSKNKLLSYVKLLDYKQMGLKAHPNKKPDLTWNGCNEVMCPMRAAGLI